MPVHPLIPHLCCTSRCVTAHAGERLSSTSGRYTLVVTIHVTSAHLPSSSTSNPQFNFDPCVDVVVVHSSSSTGVLPSVMATQPFNSAEAEFGQLHRLSDHLYCYLTSFLFNGVVPLNNRSVVVHLPADSTREAALAIINPSELTPALIADLQTLEQRTGAQVRYLISPGDWHYLFIGSYLSHFPSATAYVPPGRIPAKAPGYPYTVIDVAVDNPFPQLLPHVEAFNFRGLLDVEDPTRTKPRYELAFYHRESRAFTAADIFQYQGVGTPAPTLAARGQHFGVLAFHFFREKIIRDSGAVERSIAHIAAWRAEHYICQHGGLGNIIVGRAYEQVEAVQLWAAGLTTAASVD